MCGLVGIYSPRPQPGLADLAARLNDTQHHRGPDQSGVFTDPSGKVALAHKRLSILDLTHGRQPMTDHENRLTLVFNGEIYNHADVKRELLAKGHPVDTRSDTQTLLYAYKEWGTDCLQKLRGMFAFAVYDQRDQSLFLARDRLGIKPLYYGTCGDTFLFASECKAILAYPGFDAAMDGEALSDYLSLMYVPAPKSIYRNIRKLEAGHWMKVRPGGGMEIRPWWDLRFVDAGEYSEKDLARAEEDVLACMDESVRIHMESDVPLGAFLSGGVDSSAVVALMSKASKAAVLTNTLGFGKKGFDETDAARLTAAYFKTDHADYEVKPDAVGVLEKLAWFYDEPFADSSMIPTYYVCEAARKRVTVALSGDGGDESFAGYRRYYFDRLENRARALAPGFARKAVFGTLGAAYPKADWLPRPLRAKTLLRNLSFSPMRGYFTSMSHFLPEMKRGVLSGDFLKSLGGYDSLSVFEKHWENSGSRDPLSRIQYLDVKTYLVDDILTKVDRASMAVSLEVRVPLLDHRFMELAARMPSGFKLRGKAAKYVLKRSLTKLLPPETFTRPKTGFSIPLKDWFRKDLKDMASATLFSSRGLLASGLLDRAYVEKLWNAHQSGLSDHSYPLFALLSLSTWYDRFGSGRAAR